MKKIVIVWEQSIVEKNAKPKKNVSNAWTTMLNAYLTVHAIRDVRTDVLVVTGIVMMMKYMTIIRFLSFVSKCSKNDLTVTLSKGTKKPNLFLRPSRPSYPSISFAKLGIKVLSRGDKSFHNNHQF